MHAIELHNVHQYLINDIFPLTSTPEEQERMRAVAPKIRGAVAKFFGGIDRSNFAVVVDEVDYEFHADLLDLLGRGNVFERCDPDTAINTVIAVGVNLGEMLASRPFVAAYDLRLREILLSSVIGAEYLVRKYLEKGAKRTIYLPTSFTPADGRELLERYIGDADANLNYVRLIAEAKNNPEAGIDAKLRLQARRRAEVLTAELFTNGQGFRTGVELSVSDELDQPVVVEIDDSDGLVQRFTYSQRWLEQTLDYPSVLNNFQHLFEFVDQNVLLSFPAYPAGLGVMERVMGLTGVAEYKVGSAFRQIDSSSLLQTHMYRLFLASNGIDVEEVISWFCSTYLVDQFGAENFSFHPSADGASNLQKVRHLFAEMKSLVNQFSLFAENGELDRELLTISSEQVRYSAIPSLIEGKYVYSTGVPKIETILHLLFSDQSPLNYIDEVLNARNAAALLANGQVAYASFHDYQKPYVDNLIELGVLKNVASRVRFASGEQLIVFAALFRTQAASYFHLSRTGREEVDLMMEKGWVERRSSLLSDAEADYFNYFLNRVGFSNGPNLRNRYLHGSQAGTDDAEHFNTYVTALRLIVALVIKINDDFGLWAAERADATD